jgi:sporulation protein YlmC with PRC-barrel domain
MVYSIKKLIGYKVQAIDGDIGKVYDIFFDDRNWKIRYVVVYTGSWLSGKRVLISPNSVGQPDIKTHKFPVNLTKEKIKSSPDVDLDKPVSLQKQAELFKYYSWPIGDDFIPLPAVEIQDESISPETKEQFDQHLRSAREIIDYVVITEDGKKAGYAEDFLMDPKRWTIPYIILNTKYTRTLIPSRYIKAVDWSENRLDVDLTKDKIESAPEYTQDQFTEEFEAELKKHYKKH